jgi:hypothetical protein
MVIEVIPYSGILYNLTHFAALWEEVIAKNTILRDYANSGWQPDNSQ